MSCKYSNLSIGSCVTVEAKQPLCTACQTTLEVVVLVGVYNGHVVLDGLVYDEFTVAHHCPKCNAILKRYCEPCENEGYIIEFPLIRLPIEETVL